MKSFKKKKSTLKGNVITRKDYNPVVESKAQDLPGTARTLFGCVNCEWKNTSLCSFGFKTGKGYEKKKNNHANGICEDRVAWLKSFSSGGKLKPTFAEWQLDFNRGLAQVQMNKDYYKLKIKEGELEDYESKIDELLKNSTKEEAKIIKAKIESFKSDKREARMDWMFLWRDLTKMVDSQVSRETPKKIEVTRKNEVDITNIHEIMRKYTIPVKSKVIEEEK